MKGSRMQKGIETPSHKRKSANSSKSIPSFLGGVGETEEDIAK
jgi:hypothetical protein